MLLVNNRALPTDTKTVTAVQVMHGIPTLSRHTLLLLVQLVTRCSPRPDYRAHTSIQLEQAQLHFIVQVLQQQPVGSVKAAAVP